MPRLQPSPRHGLQPSIARSHVVPQPRPTGQVGSLGSADDYDGSFAGGLAEAVGSRLLSKQALVRALEAHLQRWQAQSGPMTHAYYEAYAGLLPAELLGLTALCDDEATFYVRRGFEGAPGESLKPSWSLGVFVGL